MEPDTDTDIDIDIDTGADEPVATGEPRVDAALRQLGALASLPASEHPPIFERVHGQLVEVLGELRADPDSLAHGQAAD